MKNTILLIFLNLLSTTIFSQINFTATTAQDTICQGESVGLNVEGDVFDSYEWSPANWITNVNLPNPTVTPLTTTTYSVTGILLGNSVIVNGDFSAGNTGFSTEYLYGPNTSGGQWGDLSDEGTYSVVTNPNISHSDFANCDDHTNGFGNMLVVNGSSNPNIAVWCQSVEVLQNANYQFSTWVTTVVGGTLAQLQFSINGNLLGNNFTAPSGTCGWVQFFETWDSGNNTNVEICIVNQNTSLGGNDFALDDISFSPIQEASSEVTVYVSDISGVVATQSAVGCDGTNGTASVAVNGGFEPYTYLWDNGETTEIATDLTEGNHAVTITDIAGCATIVNVNIPSAQLPEIDEVIIEQTTCGLDNATLEIFAGSGTAPFSYSIDGNNFQDAATFSEVAAGTFFVVIQDANGCTGASQITVNPSEQISVNIESPHGLDLCGDLPVFLDAGNFASYQWSTGETTSIIEPTEGGEYSVIVTDADNCTATSNTVEVTPCGKWEMPNAFTPNGDGFNDTFGPVIEGNAAEVLYFKIFNRWGNVVHEEKTAWDGNLEGQPHPSDVLIYVIQVETQDGVEELKGDVTLIR